MIKLNKLLTSLTIAGALLLQGCGTTNTQKGVYDPNGRLATTLADFGVRTGSGINCHDHRAPVVDCERLAREAEALHLEFPGNQRIMLVGALLQFQIGRPIDSQILLDKLLARPGANPEAAVLRSRIAMMEGNFTLARTVAERQLRLVPDYPELYEVQAASYYLEGRYDKALVAIQSADRLGAPNPRTSFHMGLIHEARGQYPQACEQYTRVLRTQPDHRSSISRLLMLSEHESCRAPRLSQR